MLASQDEFFKFILEEILYPCKLNAAQVYSGTQQCPRLSLSPATHALTHSLIKAPSNHPSSMQGKCCPHVCLSFIPFLCLDAQIFTTVLQCRNRLGSRLHLITLECRKLDPCVKMLYDVNIW